MKSQFYIFLFVSLISHSLFGVNYWESESYNIAENTYKRFNASQCDSLIRANENNPNFVILDVRTPGEWEGYHLSGSINRSTGLNDFTNQLNALPKHKIFLMHCQSGGRSAGAFAKMKELEFAEVYEMIGGINSWRSGGFPTTTSIQPKLMLVNFKTFTGIDTDTLKITVTNRANGILSFSSAEIDDLHAVNHDFNPLNQIPGAFDYTFSIYHSPKYLGEDSTHVVLESNGGKLNFTAQFKNGILQGINENQLELLSIYPNPVGENLYFKTGNNTIINEVRIFNIGGQIVLKKNMISNENSIRVSELKNGIYMVQVKTRNQSFTKRIIVKH